MTAESPNDDAALGFEEALRQLDRAVNQLEGGDLDLDGALAHYERGVHLLMRCRSMLDVAERQVAILTGVDDNGAPITAPFDASATLDRESTTTETRSRSTRTTRKIVPESEAPF